MGLPSQPRGLCGLKVLRSNTRLRTPQRFDWAPTSLLGGLLITTGSAGSFWKSILMRLDRVAAGARLSFSLLLGAPFLSPFSASPLPLLIFFLLPFPLLLSLSPSHPNPFSALLISSLGAQMTLTTRGRCRPAVQTEKGVAFRDQMADGRRD